MGQMTRPDPASCFAVLLLLTLSAFLFEVLTLLVFDLGHKSQPATASLDLVSSYAISFQPLPKYFTQNAVHITVQWLEFSVIVECKTNVHALHWKWRHVSKISSTTPLDAPLAKISDVVDGNYEAGFYKSVSALQVTACQQNFSCQSATTSPPPPPKNT